MKKLFNNTLRGLVRTTGILTMVVGFITMKWIEVVVSLIVKALTFIQYHSNRISSILCHEVKIQTNIFNKKFNL